MIKEKITRRPSPHAAQRLAPGRAGGPGGGAPWVLSVSTCGALCSEQKWPGMIRDVTLECANVPYVTLVDEPVLLLQEADKDPYTAHPVPEQQEAGKHVGEWVLCVF